MSANNDEINNLLNQDYKQGFITDIQADTFPVGLNEEVIAKLSKVKNEPEFMLEYRLKAFRHWQTMPSPDWAQLNIEPIDYQEISYYSAPKSKDNGPKSLDEIITFKENVKDASLNLKAILEVARNFEGEETFEV